MLGFVQSKHIVFSLLVCLFPVTAELVQIKTFSYWCYYLRNKYHFIYRLGRSEAAQRLHSSVRMGEAMWQLFEMG